MQEKNKLCCERHVDKAFDEFLVENETFPYIENVQDKKCNYCSEKAQYILKKMENTCPSELLE